MNSNIYFWCILQTIVLVLVGYLTLYFDLENFNNRAMVVLTTMLVIATKTSSIQAVKNILVHKYSLQEQTNKLILIHSNCRIYL